MCVCMAESFVCGNLCMCWGIEGGLSFVAAPLRPGDCVAIVLSPPYHIHNLPTLNDQGSASIVPVMFSWAAGAFSSVTT